MHRGETVIEILAEFPALDSLHHVYIGGGDNADVGFLHSRRPDLYKFTALKHTQQPRLGGQRQLGNLVKKDGASVGFLEITFTGSDSTGKRTFFMTEQLGVDGAFRNRAAVDRDIFGMFPCAVGMYYLREKLLSRTAFARDKHRQVNRSHTQGALHCGDKRRRITHDSESRFCLTHFS